MYGLPEEFTGECFLGRRAESVLFTLNTVSLAFQNDKNSLPDLSITTTAPFKHYSPTSEECQEELQTHPVRSSKLMQVIDVAIKVVKIELPGTLILEFDDGQSLTLLDDTPGQYESYYISLSGKMIVV